MPVLIEFHLGFLYDSLQVKYVITIRKSIVYLFQTILAQIEVL